MPLDTPEPELLAVIGRRMKLARDSAGLSATAAARSLGVDRRTLATWESGTRAAPISAAPRMSELYSVALDWLLAPSSGFRALIDRESERLLVTRRDTESLAEHLQTLSVIVSDRLEPVSSVAQWHQRMQAAWESAERVRREQGEQDE